MWHYSSKDVSEFPQSYWKAVFLRKNDGRLVMLEPSLQMVHVSIIYFVNWNIPGWYGSSLPVEKWHSSLTSSSFRSSVPERTYIQILKTFQEEYLDKDILVKLYAPTENRQIYSKQTL